MESALVTMSALAAPSRDPHTPQYVQLPLTTGMEGSAAGLTQDAYDLRSTTIAENTGSALGALPERDPPHVVRLHFDATPTARELAAGTGGALGSLPGIKHAFLREGVTEEMLSHALIKDVSVTGLHSNCPEFTTLGARMFANHSTSELQNSTIGIQNQEGWLYKSNGSQLGPTTSSADGGYTNLMTIHPFESARFTENKVYDPKGLQSNRFIETYGGFNEKDLWKNIVAFPSENYYFVDKNHVVTKVIKQNWDTLGINLQEEPLHDGKYFKLSGAMVDHVVDRLKEDVIEKIPFSNLADLGVRWKAKPLSMWASTPDPATKYNMSCDLKISYMFPKTQAN